MTSSARALRGLTPERRPSAATALPGTAASRVRQVPGFRDGSGNETLALSRTFGLTPEGCPRRPGPLRKARAGYDRRRCASRSFCSTSTGLSSTPAGSSSPRCGTRRAPCSGASTPTRSCSRRSAARGSRRRWQVLAEDRVDELVRVYREHNEPLHDTLEFCAGMEDVLDDAEGAGLPARPGHREAARRPSSSRSPGCRWPACSRWSSAATRPSGTSRAPSRSSSASSGSGVGPDDAAYVGDSPVRHAGRTRRRDGRDRRHAGGGSTAATRSRDADVVVDTAEELLAVL